MASEGGRNSMASIHALDRLIGNDYPDLFNGR